VWSLQYSLTNQWYGYLVQVAGTCSTHLYKSSSVYCEVHIASYLQVSGTSTIALWCLYMLLKGNVGSEINTSIYEEEVPEDTRKDEAQRSYQTPQSIFPVADTGKGVAFVSAQPPPPPFKVACTPN